MAEPVLVGLLFADRIIIENNGKKGIIGTFNRFHAAQFPVVFPPWAIYAAVTNLVGKHRFELNLGADDNSQIVIPINGEFDVKQRLDIVELTPAIAGAVFPAQGRYNLMFSIDGEPVGARVLTVERVESKGSVDPGEPRS